MLESGHLFCVSGQEFAFLRGWCSVTEYCMLGFFLMVIKKKNGC